MLTAPYTARLRTHLGEMPVLIAHTHLALLPAAGAQGDRVTGATRTPPLPCRLAALDELGPRRDGTPTLAILTSWAAAVVEDRRKANDWTGWVRVPAGPRLPYALDSEHAAATATAALRFHLDYAVLRPYAEDLAEEVAELHHHLSSITGVGPRPARPVRSACPSCRVLGLCERTDGVRECLACRNTFEPAEYTASVEQTIGELTAA
ncbi:hypothetical protein ACWGB8_07925 [Kitasatospora sp. NPDC054939]